MPVCASLCQMHLHGRLACMYTEIRHAGSPSSSQQHNSHRRVTQLSACCAGAPLSHLCHPLPGAISKLSNTKQEPKDLLNIQARQPQLKEAQRCWVQVLAGALQDNKRAVIVGEPTFGKGLIQTIVEMSDGSAVVATAARYRVSRQLPWTQPAQQASACLCCGSSPELLPYTRVAICLPRNHTAGLRGRPYPEL